MRIAILGATSQIAKDLTQSFCTHSSHELVLYARRPEVVLQWLASVGMADRYAVDDFAAFNTEAYFDAILNFVGVGNPAQAAAMGASIFDVTLQYDEMALDYVRQNPDCRYIFLSSGAAYGSTFDAPADENTKAVIAINDLQPQDWYGVAKLHAECRHRSLDHLPIVDIRVFNYFSHTQDINARFLITDIVRAIRDGELLTVTAGKTVRDFLHPSDFHTLIESVLVAPPANTAVDCYTLEPIDKVELLEAMSQNFGLRYEISENLSAFNATGGKSQYYSLNRHAASSGYTPSFTSLQGVLREVKLMSDKFGFVKKFKES